MQTDKELFSIIKETYPMNPKADFISKTELHLRNAAEQMTRKRNPKLLFITASAFLVCMTAVLLILPFSGGERIYNKLVSLGENHSKPSVSSQEPLIYIYHSHDQESFFSETQTTDPNKAYHPSKNITQVGERFSQSLMKNNIDTIHETRDVMGSLRKRGLSFSNSYSVSREFLTDILETNKSIKMVFDIHRDAQTRNDTTFKNKGKDFATFTLVVSRSNMYYEDNFKFAESLHNKMEEKYPGLSNGVIVISNPGNQSTYNQDLISGSILLNIGGVENTLEEEYRTVDVLAKVIAEILKAEK
ncbi:stage II sporulation protein P [Cytobacillus massiliigabonensis]|uniref:stage II sporulation protein P n=1 Tax=Cytobacillus massiliigabonensis TaxID=1871011 RepID=UPI000C830821|nr:stage II sporulation protein P [Cytobacillus massiliigabonensis]